MNNNLLEEEEEEAKLPYTKSIQEKQPRVENLKKLTKSTSLEEEKLGI